MYILCVCFQSSSPNWLLLSVPTSSYRPLRDRWLQLQPPPSPTPWMWCEPEYRYRNDRNIALQHVFYDDDSEMCYTGQTFGVQMYSNELYYVVYINKNIKEHLKYYFNLEFNFHIYFKMSFIPGHFKHYYSSLQCHTILLSFLISIDIIN